MAKKINVDYRKICQEHNGYNDEQMIGMDVHHIDKNRNNNHPTNLTLLTPEEHAKIHKNDFILWSRKGSKLGNEAFIKRLKEQGPTEKEIAHQKRMVEIRKKGLHRVPHSEETKKTISENKKIGLEILEYNPYIMIQNSEVYIERLISRTPEKYRESFRIAINTLPEYIEIPTNEVFIVGRKK